MSTDELICRAAEARICCAELALQSREIKAIAQQECLVAGLRIGTSRKLMQHSRRMLAVSRTAINERNALERLSKAS